MTGRKPPVVVPKMSRRDWAFAISGGILLLGLILFGISQMSRGVAGSGITGIIVEKHFTPQPPETQITIGRGGVHERQVDGTYRFIVRVPAEDGKIYTVWVDKNTYENRKIGGKFYFLRPKEKSVRLP